MIAFCFMVLCIKVTMATQIIYRNHSCVPSAYTKMCILDNLFNYPGKKNVVHTFPPNQTHVRIICDTWKSRIWAQMVDINAKLHTLLGQPEILEMQGCAMRHFELPRALEQGIFARLQIRNLTVEPGTDILRVVYLDLSRNYVRDIANASSLVNLEVFLLRNHYIINIDPITMQNLTKLRILDLSYNHLTLVSINIFPKSLTNLNLFLCRIYAHMYYPSMEVFNIEKNVLTSIDGPALILAMPKLKVLRLGSNQFDQEELQEALQMFRRHNISVRDEAVEAACAFDGKIILAECMAEPSLPTGVMWEILSSLVVILIVIALGASLRWVYIRMQGSK